MPENQPLGSNQNQAMILAGNESQSTHHEAAQASAARFIEILRNAYPALDMQERMDNNVGPTEATIRLHAEQKKLHDILEQQIASFASNEPNQEEATLQDQLKNVQSPIHATLSMIAIIKELKTPLREDIIHVLRQMLDISKTCPGFTWSDQLRQWCINAIFDAQNDQVVFIIASPAQTLNFVCRAILDEERYPRQTSDGKSAVENQALRIDSFVRCILELHRLKNEQQKPKCSGGVQHDLLHLLTQNYHDKPCSHSNAKPMMWVGNTTAYIFEKLTDYVAHKLKQGAAEAVIIDWIKFQEAPLSNNSDIPHPLISFLRSVYSTKANDPDTAWKEDCKAYLTEQCLLFGLNPFLCPLDDIIDAITNLQPPDLEGGLTTIMLQLMQAKPIQNPNNSILTNQRNETILCFQSNLDKSRWDTIKPTVKNLFTAEEAFGLFIKNQTVIILAGLTQSDFTKAFKTATIKLQLALSDFYTVKTTNDMQALLEIKSQYLEAVNTYKVQSHMSYIEAFFSSRSYNEYNPGADPLLRKCPIINDVDLEKWNRMQISKQGYFELTEMSVYEVNRLLLLALAVPSMNWSPTFCMILIKLARSLRSFEVNTSPSIQALRSTIPFPVLENFALLACIQNSNDDLAKQTLSYRADNEEIKKILTSPLIATLNKTQFESIFQFLLQRKEDVFISVPQLAYCLSFNLSSDDQNSLVRAIPQSVYKVGSGMLLYLFKLPINKLGPDERKYILHLNRERFSEIIPKIFNYLFALPIEQLSKPEREILFNPDPNDSTFISYDFYKIFITINDLCKLFQLSIEQLSAVQRTAILNSLGRRIAAYILNYTSLYQLFSLDMNRLSEENRDAIFQKIQPQLADMPVDGLIELLSLSLEQLTPLQRDQMVLAAPDMNDYSSLYRLFSLDMSRLSAENRDAIFQKIQPRLANMPVDGLVELLSLSLEQLTPLQREIILCAAPEDITTFITDANSLMKFLLLKPPIIPLNQRDAFFSKIASKIPAIIRHHSEFITLFDLSFDEFSESSRKVVIKELQNHFHLLLRKPDDANSPTRRLFDLTEQPIPTLLNLCIALELSENELNQDPLAFIRHARRLLDVTEPSIPTLLNLCITLELSEAKLNQDVRAFICHEFIEVEIKNTINQILELKSKIDVYPPSDSQNQERLTLIKQEVSLCRQMTTHFTGHLIRRLLKLSDKHITQGARDSVLQLFFLLINDYIHDISHITAFLELSPLDFNEDHRRELILYTLKYKNRLFSNLDNLRELFHLSIEHLSEPLREDIINKSNFSWSMNTTIITKMSSLFNEPIECFSVKNREQILTQILLQAPSTRLIDMPYQLVELIRNTLYYSELSTKSRTVFWNKIRPTYGDDFPDIPGREASLANAIEAQHYQTALDAVFKGKKLEESIIMYDNGSIVNGLVYLENLIQFDETISESLRHDLTIFKQNLLLAEKLTCLKQTLGYGQSKHTHTNRFFMKNTPLTKYLLESIFELQHAMIEEPLQNHPEILSFIERYQDSDLRVKLLSIPPYNKSYDEFTFTKLPYNAQTLHLKLNQLKTSQNAEMAIDLARSVGSQLLLLLIKTKCLGARIFEYIEPENIVITEDGLIILHANLLLKRTHESALERDAILMSRMMRIIYTIACQTTWDPTQPMNLSSEKIKDDQLLSVLTTMFNGSPTYNLIMAPFFYSQYTLSSPDEFFRQMKLLEEKERDPAAEPNPEILLALPILKKEAAETLEVKIPLQQTEWFEIKKKLAPNIALVTITSEEKRNKYQITHPKKYCIIKTLTLSPNKHHLNAVRRAISIMERAHHPGIIKMAVATRQEGSNLVEVCCWVSESGSLQQILPTLNNVSMRVQLLLAVTCQVLNALVFLHYKLSAAHRDITPDHILFNPDGRVTLCGFDSTGQRPEQVPSDMSQLSDMLLRLLPQNQEHTESNLEEATLIQEARDFAQHLSTVDPYTALQHRTMRKYYTDKGYFDEMSNQINECKTALKVHKIEGSTPIEEMKSWCKYDEQNPTSEARFNIRGKMKELCLLRVIFAVSTVRDILMQNNHQAMIDAPDAAPNELNTFRL
jgi:hypothetical protein